jgi:hypothetical protein
MDSVVAPEKQLPPCATRTGFYRGEHGAEDLIELIIFSTGFGFWAKNIRRSCEIGWIQVPDSKEAIRGCSVALACQGICLSSYLGTHWSAIGDIVPQFPHEQGGVGWFYTCTGQQAGDGDDSFHSLAFG